MDVFIAGLIVQYPILSYVLLGLGLFVVVVQTIVFITPSKKDDAILAKAESNPIVAKIISFLVSFAPIQKSAKGLELSNTSLDKK